VEYKIIKDKARVDKAWQTFLSQKGYKIGLSDHSITRFKERFPDLSHLKQGEIIKMIKGAKPIIKIIRSTGSIIIVRNKKVVFVVCLDQASAITVYIFNPQEYKGLPTTKKSKRKKEGYKRKKFDWREYEKKHEI